MTTASDRPLPEPRILTVEEAIEIIRSGQHSVARSELRDPELDEAAIAELLSGEIEAAILPDGQLAFRRLS